MKLATALTERSDVQRRLSELQSRLNNNAKVQEGDEPSEPPSALLAELDALLARLEELVTRINLTNSATYADGVPLTALLSRRDALRLRVSTMRSFLDCASQKTDRYARIAREAVKQCGRSAVPDVLPALTVPQALERMKRHERLLMPYENGGEAFGAPIDARDVALLIGPEGGISPEEAQAVQSIGGTAVTLGSRILRTETAGLVALTLTLHCAGDLGGMA